MALGAPDDNALSQCQFKTMKDQPDYPGRSTARSTGAADCRISSAGGATTIVTRDSSLALFTPAEFFGRVALVAAGRQAALDIADRLSSP